MHKLVITIFIHLNQRGVVKMFACHVYRTLFVSGITKSQQALIAWEGATVVNQFEVSLGPRDTHYVVVYQS
jgi:hypothetical protein